MKKYLLLLLFPILLLTATARPQSCTNHQIDISWAYAQGSDPATGFYVFAEQQGQTKFTQLNSVQLPISQLVFSDCTPNGGYTYSYYVTAVDAQGNQSSPSNTWVSGVVGVDPPSGVTVKRNSDGSNSVLWTNGGDGGTATLGRSLQACGAAGATFTQIATGVFVTNYTDLTPPASSNYCYSVADVVNGVASTAAFGGVSVPPAAVSGLTGRVVK